MTSKEFIQNIIDMRGQWGIVDGYWEGHHIIPACKGGDGNTRKKDKNIVRLYAREHYEVHKLLALENPYDWDLVNAFHCISHMYINDSRKVISASEYEEAKLMMSECIRNSYPYTIECIDTGMLYRCPAEAATELNIKCSNNIGQCCRGKRVSCNGYHFRFYNCDIYDQNKPIKKIADEGPILCVETSRIYEKASDISDDYFKYNKIVACCKGKCCTVMGYHWKFVDDTDYNIKEDKRFNYRTIICVETKEEYTCISEAVRKTGIKNIKKVLYGERVTAGGYHWKYK